MSSTLPRINSPTDQARRWLRKTFRGIRSFKSSNVVMWPIFTNTARRLESCTMTFFVRSSGAFPLPKVALPQIRNHKRFATADGVPHGPPVLSAARLRVQRSRDLPGGKSNRSSSMLSSGENAFKLIDAYGGWGPGVRAGARGWEPDARRRIPLSAYRSMNPAFISTTLRRLRLL